MLSSFSMADDGFEVINCLFFPNSVHPVSRVSVQKPMPKDKEQEGQRVTFERPFPAHMMAIDGTWRRSCALKDVSETAATLQVEGSIEGLAVKEFFLLLSTAGLAYRRCELDGVNGDEIKVTFLRQKAKARTPKKPT
jgi:hypothetical protein